MVAFSVATIAAATSGVAGPPNGSPVPNGPPVGVDAGLELAVAAIAWINTHLQAILAAAYDRAPVLVVVMAALLIIPLSALTGLLAHSLRLRFMQGRPSPRAADALASFRAHPLAAATPEAALWPHAAWLEFDGGTEQGQQRLLLPRAQGLVRIGRHDDNDIRLPYSTVHRHHALIHRTPTAQFVIMDLSGHDGNGVVINGEKTTEAQLAPGDLIVLGDARLRFDSAPL